MEPQTVEEWCELAKQRRAAGFAGSVALDNGSGWTAALAVEKMRDVDV